MIEGSTYRSVQEYEDEAERVLPRYVWDFFSTGAEGEKSLRRNREIWKSLLILPRALCNTTGRNQRVTLLGKFHLDSPIGVSPTAFNGFAHPEGEKAVAKACAALNAVYTPSGISSKPLEEIAAAGGPNGIRWQNIYLFDPASCTQTMIKRAEAAGFGAIVISVDIPTLGRRIKGPSHLGIASHAYLPISENRHLWAGNFPPYDRSHVHGDPKADWDTLRWAIGETRLPVVAKGIMRVEDAVKAADAGVAAIIVSNHGTRQLDSTPAPIEVLPGIVEAVGNRVEIYIDGGIRFGSDVYKCLALGAKAVFIGRPSVYGLAVDGQKGVEGVLNILRGELDVSMALTGCTTVEDITSKHLLHESKLLSSRL